jgi:RNA polymerase sigma-70 factor (ECF subfamily)
MDRVATFEQHRPLLFSIAYRMLGSASDAEDLVQDAFLRWQHAADADIASPRAWLSTIVTRLAIDHLRSARVQRETYIGPWLPEPLVTEQAPGASERLALAESLSMAFLVMLETLGPVERAVFLLREVFDYDYEEIAAIVGKSADNCRQMLHRARQHLVAGRPRFAPSPEEHTRLTQQFLATAATGDLPALVALLAEDVTLWSDGGGKTTAARNPIHGPDRVARFITGVMRKAPREMGDVRMTQVNGEQGLVGYVDGQARFVVSLEVRDERVQAVRIVVNPDKLRTIPSLQ